MTIHYSSATLGFYDDTVINPALIPAGAVVVDSETYTTLMTAVASGQVVANDTNGNPIAVAPAAAPSATPQQLELQYASALTNAINTVAQAWQYDNIYTAATYLTSQVPQFAAEAAALVSWRDAAWNSAQTLLKQVQAGTTAMPASSAAFLAAVLPTAPTRPTV